MAKVRKDLTGKIYGQLAVLKLVGRDGGTQWLCQCSCGKQAIRTTDQLTAGVRSCGCLHGKAQRKNIADQTFGKLTARHINEDASRPKQVRWDCDCECGKSVTVRARDLFSGNTQSCGCGSSRIQTIHGQSRTLEMKRFYAMKRLTAKKHRTPKWADMETIRTIYLNCPDGHEVDHIIPLQGKLVSGLHVEDNLQYLTKQENWNKKHKFEPQFISR